MSDTYDLILAAYPTLEAAQHDFDALVGLVKDKKVKSDGVILVTKDEAGEVHVAHTADKLGRKGAGWGGGVGVLVGLAAPPLLGAVAVGAAAGGVVGHFAKKKVDSGLEAGMADKLKPGMAMIVAMVDADDRLAAEMALPGSPAKSVAPMDKKRRARPQGRARRGGRQVRSRPHRAADPRQGVRRRDRPHDRPSRPPTGRSSPAPSRPRTRPTCSSSSSTTPASAGPTRSAAASRTPNLTRVQEMGLTYNRFHVTAVCSPTRAALLTGRNHHRVGMGGIAEFPGPFPGYTGTRPRSCTALPRILRENGYITGGFGKWHMTPGPRDGRRRPVRPLAARLGLRPLVGLPDRRRRASTTRSSPRTTRRSACRPRATDGKLYYFPDDITDKAVEWLHAVRAQDADKPWFMYYSTGCAHAPHHVAKEWADKYKGQFDDGWDAYREKTFERQKKLGIVPPDTELTERPDLFPAWDSLSDAEKKLYARQMEVFAGYSENADWNVGRLLDSIDEMGDLDNTLVIYIWGDNGASMEGTLTGSFNETTFFNGVVLDADEQLELIEKFGGIEELGGFHTAPHFAAAWAWANNAPFQWGKQMASHLGGTRDPMVVAWPSRIKPDAAVRSQFTHCIDVVPDDPRRRRHPRAHHGRRHRAGAHGRHQLRLHLRRRRAPTSSTRCSTSRCTAAAPSTRTAGGPAPSSTSCPGTSRPRRSSASRPAATGTPRTTRGSSTTCPTTSARRTTWPPSSPRSWPSSRSCSGPRPSATARCRCSAAMRSSSACCRRCRPRRASSSTATCRTCRRR